MSSASERQAADRLLLEGRVKVVRRSEVSIRARVRSTTRRHHDCGWSIDAGWWCSCGSPSAMCACLRAVRRVCVTPRPTRDPLAFVTTLSRLPSRVELYAEGAAPEKRDGPAHDPRPSGRPSPRDAELRYGAA